MGRILPSNPKKWSRDGFCILTNIYKCHDMTIILTTNSEVYRGYSHKSGPWPCLTRLELAKGPTVETAVRQSCHSHPLS